MAITQEDIDTWWAAIGGGPIPDEEQAMRLGSTGGMSSGDAALLVLMLREVAP